MTIAVDDLEESIRFYRDVFGWKPVPAEAAEAAKIVFFQLNGFQLALYPLAAFAAEHEGQVGRPNGFTLAYTVNSAEQVDAAFARFAEHEVEVLKAPVKLFWGGYGGYVAGPSGEQWEIAYNPYTQVNPDGTFGHQP